MKLRASIKEAVHYCSFPSLQNEADFFPSQCQNCLAVWQNLDALLPTKRWTLLRLEAHHDNWKVFVTHEPENRAVRNYSVSLSLNRRAWDGLCPHGWSPPASKQDGSMRTNYWEWSWASAKPRTMQGCCWVLLAPLGHKVTYREV